MIYTKKEIDEIEKIYLKAVKKDIWCCADQGICHHDSESIAKLRAHLVIDLINNRRCYGQEK